YRGGQDEPTKGRHRRLEGSSFDVQTINALAFHRLALPWSPSLRPFLALPLRFDPIAHLMIVPTAGAPAPLACAATFILGDRRCGIGLTGKASPLHLSDMLG